MTTGFSTKRLRLIICVSIYGSSLGAAAVLITFLARTRFPKEPEHMELATSIIFASSAGVVGALLAGLITFWAVPNPDQPRSIFYWAFLGFAFGILLPFFTGLTLPFGTSIVSFTENVITLREMFLNILGSFFKAPTFAFVHGVFGLFTGMLAGALLAAGSWLINRVNAGESRYLSYVVAIVLFVVVIILVSYLPTSFLAKLA